MIYTDAAVIGAGILGCFAARALKEMDIQVAVIEQREDACTGITRANSGIIYTGCDNRPGSLKAELCTRANRSFDTLCRELNVRFSRCGSLMAAFGPKAEAVLAKKLKNGTLSGVQGLRILGKKEALELEPNLSSEVTAALYAPGTGVADPWELCYAAYENAKANGVGFFFGQKLLRMERTPGGFLLETEKESFSARTVINCAGLSADAVREMLEIPAVRIFPSAADYIVLDNTVEGFVKHVIFHEPEERKKGLTLVPTVDGSLLIGPTERNRATAPDGAADRKGLRQLKELCEEVVPSLPLEEQIRGFSALRPNPFIVEQKEEKWVPADRSIHDFSILQENGLISLIGIKTPGITCAAELGRRAAGMVSEYLHDPPKNPSFNPVRPAPVRIHEMPEDQRNRLVHKDPAYGKILCQCQDVSLGEVRDAIIRGAVSLDGVKRRVGTGMGRCQGARCMKAVTELLAEAQGVQPFEVTKDGAGTAMFFE